MEVLLRISNFFRKLAGIASPEDRNKTANRLIFLPNKMVESYLYRNPEAVNKMFLVFSSCQGLVVPAAFPRTLHGEHRLYIYREEYKRIESRLLLRIKEVCPERYDPDVLNGGMVIIKLLIEIGDADFRDFIMQFNEVASYFYDVLHENMISIEDASIEKINRLMNEIYGG